MTSGSPNPRLLEVWRFVRGDCSPKAFERWICENLELESFFGGPLYLELISASYGDPYVVVQLKERLGAWARALDGPGCRCITLADLSVVDMGADDAEVFATLKNEIERGGPFWWLSAYECSACGDHWLVGQEERQNDVFCMRRLSHNEWLGIESGKGWPSDFDSYEALLRIGRDFGRCVRFLDPMDSSLRWTIQDLAKARPGIRVSELASLLNLELGIASQLARDAAIQERLDITFDDE
jgi:hypothetical protein